MLKASWKQKQNKQKKIQKQSQTKDDIDLKKQINWFSSWTKSLCE